MAEELGVKPSNLDKVADLPPPEQIVTGRRVWRADDIRRFAERRRQQQ